MFCTVECVTSFYVFVADFSHSSLLYLSDSFLCFVSFDFNLFVLFITCRIFVQKFPKTMTLTIVSLERQPRTDILSIYY